LLPAPPCFDLEDGSNMFLQNVRRFSSGYMALCPRRQNSSLNNELEII
jgi:hypothetical protein